jgi:hypothetical protein
MLADQFDLSGPQPGLLRQLPPGGLARFLAALEPALGQLPLARQVGPLEGHDLAARRVAHHHHHSRPEPLRHGGAP